MVSGALTGRVGAYLCDVTLGMAVATGRVSVVCVPTNGHNRGGKLSQVFASRGGHVLLGLPVLLVRSHQELLLEEAHLILVIFDSGPTTIVEKPPFATKRRLHVGIEDRVVSVQVYVRWKPFPATATVSM